MSCKSVTFSGKSTIYALINMFTTKASTINTKSCQVPRAELNNSSRRSIQPDHSVILQKCLDGAIFLYILIREIRSTGDRASIAVVQIRRFFKCKRISLDLDSLQNG